MEGELMGLETQMCHKSLSTQYWIGFLFLFMGLVDQRLVRWMWPDYYIVYMAHRNRSYTAGLILLLLSMLPGILIWVQPHQMGLDIERVSDVHIINPFTTCPYPDIQILNLNSTSPCIQIIRRTKVPLDWPAVCGHDVNIPRRPTFAGKAQLK